MEKSLKENTLYQRRAAITQTVLVLVENMMIFEELRLLIHELVVDIPLNLHFGLCTSVAHPGSLSRIRI